MTLFCCSPAGGRGVRRPGRFLLCPGARDPAASWQRGDIPAPPPGLTLNNDIQLLFNTLLLTVFSFCVLWIKRSGDVFKWIMNWSGFSGQLWCFVVGQFRELTSDFFSVAARCSSGNKCFHTADHHIIIYKLLLMSHYLFLGSDWCDSGVTSQRCLSVSASSASVFQTHLSFGLWTFLIRLSCFTCRHVSDKPPRCLTLKLKRNKVELGLKRRLKRGNICSSKTRTGLQWRSWISGTKLNLFLYMFMSHTV